MDFDFDIDWFPDPYFFETDRMRMEEVDEDLHDPLFHSPIPGEEGDE